MVPVSKDETLPDVSPIAASEEACQGKAGTEVPYLPGPATARELATNLAWR